MAVKKVTLPDFPPLFGWRNRLLRINLSDSKIWAEDISKLAPDFIGGRGFAAKIMWDEFAEPVDPFDENSPLFIMPGALTGARSPYSGRTHVSGFSPQCYPYNWFTRASMGSTWGHELKKAGYDGIVITGASESPVRILIQDSEVSLIPAEELWGLDTLTVQTEIMSRDGKGVKTLTIGPAGEVLSRIATIHTASSSVAGQGGFGAVMGSKKLKAITVSGTGAVPIAHPSELRTLFSQVTEATKGLRGGSRMMEFVNARLEKEGGGKARLVPCTMYCVTPCRMEITNRQGRTADQKINSVIGCVSGLFGGSHGRGNSSIYDWHLSMHGTMDINMHANRLGLNHWDILVGIVPWIRTCLREGIMTDFDGLSFDWNSTEFWTAFLDAIAYRTGTGYALAEGGYRAAKILNIGYEIMRRYYTGWGYSGHWDGHAAFANDIVYPFWIVAALHWMMDTRDPASSTHGYVQNVMHHSPFGRRWARAENPMTWDDMRGIGKRVYGRADTLDPLSDYEGKAVPAVYHAIRSIMKDSLPTDDQIFPLIYSTQTEDHFCRVGELDGPDVDAYLFRAGTGIDWDPAEFSRAAERVLNLERAISVRHFAKDREMDERIIPSFEYEENGINPMVGKRMRLERSKFSSVVDDYYAILGWDVETGWPTEKTLSQLGLDIHEEMIASATKAKEKHEKLAPVSPIHDIHQFDPERLDDKGK
jgi:aldehyde:ferredoxin oxidoreductase